MADGPVNQFPFPLVFRPPPPELASDRLAGPSLQKGPHSFRLSPGDRRQGGRIPNRAHPKNTDSASDWLRRMPIATSPAFDWLSGRRSARRRLRPRRVFVVGLRSRRSRRKLQDNGDPGRRVRLSIQRCAAGGAVQGARVVERRRRGCSDPGQTLGALSPGGPVSSGFAATSMPGSIHWGPLGAAAQYGEPKEAPGTQGGAGPDGRGLGLWAWPWAWPVSPTLAVSVGRGHGRGRWCVGVVLLSWVLVG